MGLLLLVLVLPSVGQQVNPRNRAGGGARPRPAPLKLVIELNPVAALARLQLAATRHGAPGFHDTRTSRGTGGLPHELKQLPASFGCPLASAAQQTLSRLIQMQALSF